MAIKLGEQVRPKAEAFYRFDVCLDRRHFSISRTAIGSRFIGFLFAMPSIFFSPLYKYRSTIRANNRRERNFS